MALRPLSRAERRALIERAYAHGVAAMQPGAAIRRVLRMTDTGFAVGEIEIPVRGRLLVVAIGKAAPPMAATVADLIGDRIQVGWILTKDGHLEGELPAHFTAWEASHPVPDERGISASRLILAGVEGLTTDDVVLALISGGGSALFEAPRDALTLEDMQRVTDLLLRAGAPIQHLNAVRSELSLVKGGGFRRAVGKARVVSLILSDVLGNAPEVIASGPTIPRAPDPEGATDLLERYEVLGRVPDTVRSTLGRSVTSDGVTSAASRDIFEIVGDNAGFVRAAEAFFTEKGLTTYRFGEGREGEARDRAVEWVNEVKMRDAQVLLAGGEMTVTVRGAGRGGRNTEFALGAARVLPANELPLTVASLASDGEDGSAPAAGGIVDESTAQDLKVRGIDAEASLEANDSATALAAVGALFSPGPTGTNVNDVYIAIRG